MNDSEKPVVANAIQGPRLSVIVPNYNHAAYLPRCLKALLDQSVAPFEVIVIDDASTDNSLEVLAEFARKYPALQVHRNEKNQGALFGLNRGLRLAKGDYVFFPGADDEVAPGLFEASLGLLSKHPPAAFCCTISEWREGDLIWHMAAGMSRQPCFLSPEEMVELGKKGKLFLVSHSAIYRKDALVQAGGFRAELRWHCDWYATYVTGFRHGICYVPKVLSVVNILPKSWYKAGHRQAEQRQVISNLLELLSAPECSALAPRIRDSGVLAVFGAPLLRVLAGQAQYRRFLTPSLLAKTLRRVFELQAKRLLPAWLARLGIKLLYRKQGA